MIFNSSTLFLLRVNSFDGALLFNQAQL